MNLLVTLDSNYVHQLLVMLKSISHSNPCEKLTVYIIHTRLTEFDLALIKSSFPKYSFISIVQMMKYLTVLILQKELQRKHITGFCYVNICRVMLTEFSISTPTQ